MVIRALKFWWQRRTRGWDDSDTWSLDYTCAKWLLPRFRRYRELQKEYFGDIETIPENNWKEAYDKIDFALSRVADDSDYDYLEDGEKVKEGLELLGKYFESMWW